MTEYHYNNDELKSKLTTVSNQLKALADGYRDLMNYFANPFTLVRGYKKLVK